MDLTPGELTSETTKCQPLLDRADDMSAPGPLDVLLAVLGVPDALDHHFEKGPCRLGML